MKPTIFLLLAAVAVASCNDDKNDTKSVSEQDQTFSMSASMANQAEIQISGLVSDRSNDSTVRAFALHMIAEHVVALNELKMIANNNKNITISTDLDSLHAQLRRKLMMLDSVAFDTLYINSMVSDHKKVIAQFQAESSMGEDADLKAYADKYLPNLNEHLATAQTIQKSLMTPVSATGGRKKSE